MLFPIVRSRAADVHVFRLKRRQGRVVRLDHDHRLAHGPVHGKPAMGFGVVQQRLRGMGLDGIGMAARHAHHVGEFDRAKPDAVYPRAGFHPVALCPIGGEAHEVSLAFQVQYVLPINGGKRGQHERVMLEDDDRFLNCHRQLPQAVVRRIAADGSRLVQPAALVLKQGRAAFAGDGDGFDVLLP